MKRLSSQQRVNVNVSGGNDNVRFFSNVSFLHQGSWFKTENEEYKSNPNFTWFNYRTNVDVKLNKYLSGYVNLSGNIRRGRPITRPTRCTASTRACSSFRRRRPVL